MGANVSPFAFFAGDLCTFVFTERIYAALLTFILSYAMFTDSARCILQFGVL